MTDLTSNGIPSLIPADDGGTWVLDQDPDGEITTCTIPVTAPVAATKSTLDLGYYIRSV